MKEIEKNVEYKVKVVIEMDKERRQDKQIDKSLGKKNCNSISLFRYIFEGSHILERIYFQHKYERREETWQTNR